MLDESVKVINTVSKTIVKFENLIIKKDETKRDQIIRFLNVIDGKVNIEDLKNQDEV